jgi:hypothetical protein
MLERLVLGVLEILGPLGALEQFSPIEVSQPNKPPVVVLRPRAQEGAVAIISIVAVLSGTLTLTVPLLDVLRLTLCILLPFSFLNVTVTVACGIALCPSVTEIVVVPTTANAGAIHPIKMPATAVITNFRISTSV